MQDPYSKHCLRFMYNSSLHYLQGRDYCICRKASKHLRPTENSLIDKSTTNQVSKEHHRAVPNLCGASKELFTVSTTHRPFQTSGEWGKLFGLHTKHKAPLTLIPLSPSSKTHIHPENYFANDTISNKASSIDIP